MVSALAEVCEIYGVGEVGAAEELHDGLEVIFAAAHDADSVTLNLGFDFGVCVANALGDVFGFFLVEAGDERYFLGTFEV